MSTNSRIEMLPVLLVEDDAEDIYIAQRAFEQGKIANPLHVVRSGEEALEFLQRTGCYVGAAEAPRPGLILLDLNLPGMRGHEVLERIKQDPQLRRIPVVVLTTSGEEADVCVCYDRGANTYIVKPVAFDKFLEAVKTVGRYWLVVAKLPDPCEDTQV